MAEDMIGSGCCETSGIEDAAEDGAECACACACCD